MRQSTAAGSDEVCPEKADHENLNAESRFTLEMF